MTEFWGQPKEACGLWTGVEKDPSNSLDPNSTQIPIGGSVTVTLVAGTLNSEFGGWQGIPDKLASGSDVILESSTLLLYFNGTTMVPTGPG